MRCQEIKIPTHGEGFYEITEKVSGVIETEVKKSKVPEGLLYLFIPHTSCALVINESYDPSAKKDMENFLKVLSPRDMSFITHTAEGEDDSPSHMKSMLLHQNLALPIEDGKIKLGTWQGIYLSEFRDAYQSRKLWIKYIPDSD